MGIRTVQGAFLSILVFMAVSTLGAETATLSYMEGDVSARGQSGSQRVLEIGDLLANGDTVFTGEDSLAELQLGSGSTVTVQSSSVFSVGEIADTASEGRKRSFFRVVLGAVAFKFRNLTQEPDIGTPLTVCSVRGTDFTVYSAQDGSSLTVVSDGLVEVSSGGRSTLLTAGQGVQATGGIGLGESFDVKRGWIRYEEFAEEALSRIDDDPVGSLDALTEQMVADIEEGVTFRNAWETNFVEFEKMWEKVRLIRNEKGEEASQAAFNEFIRPLQLRAADLNTTYRHYFLSALSLRRYIVSGLYIHLRAKYLTQPDNPDWLEFQTAYQEFLSVYENLLIPRLEDEDL